MLAMPTIPAWAAGSDSAPISMASVRSFPKRPVPHRSFSEAVSTDVDGSWQRGSNENRNGRIRRYLPKGTSFEDLTQDELDAIVGEINDTPMKLLGYKTPNEVWDEEMAKLQSKQADPKPAVALTS